MLLCLGFSDASEDVLLHQSYRFAGNKLVLPELLEGIFFMIVFCLSLVLGSLTKMACLVQILEMDITYFN